MNKAARVSHANLFRRTESERVSIVVYARGESLTLEWKSWAHVTIMSHMLYCPTIDVCSSFNRKCAYISFVNFCWQDVDEEIVGHLRSAAGKARLLATQKIRQFEGMSTCLLLYAFD